MVEQRAIVHLRFGLTKENISPYFLKFDLEKSGETVVREDGFKNTEHWNATAEFDQEDTVLKIVFYDID